MKSADYIRTTSSLRCRRTAVFASALHGVRISRIVVVFANSAGARLNELAPTFEELALRLEELLA